MAGLKKSMDNPKNIRVSAYVTRETADKIAKKCETWGLSISEYLSELIYFDLGEPNI